MMKLRSDFRFVALTFCAMSIFLSGSLDAEETQEVKQSPRAVEAESAPQSFVKLAKQVRPSVVTVTHLGRDGRELGIGTGFVIDDKKGLIATNLHVIGEARLIRVKFRDRTTTPVESVYAIDRDADLAILKIDVSGIDRSILKPLSLGEAAEQGESVAAIGHPNGLKNTLVTGVVSGTQEINGRELIQVAMPIDFGNSGGPLLNRKGEVLGIITYKSASITSIGFAMPVADLKRLLKNPHPVSMNRWMTIGALDSKVWQPDDVGMWRQRAGRIHVSGLGKGFGGRSLCLWKQLPKKPDEYEVGVFVKLEQEAGAAGLVFQTDEKSRHYGFYPSKGSLRLSRFDGADVFRWKVLKEVSTPSYHPGEWNFLKVAVKGNLLKCYCNDDLIFELQEKTYLKGKVGLAKFRDTVAQFRGFQLAQKIDNYRLDKELANRIKRLLEEKQSNELLSITTVKQMSQFPEASQISLEEAAKALEQRAGKLRKLSQLTHQYRVSQQMMVELKKKQPHLTELSLLLARFDNPEVDLKFYRKAIGRLSDEIGEGISKNLKDQKSRRLQFDKLFFQEFGFHGSTTNYYSKSNSYLNEVIDDREGLPISLAVLYIAAAEKLKLDIRGVGLPGHFVVQQYIDNKPGDVIDVFNKGAVLSRDEMVMRVEIQAGRTWNDEYLKPKSSKEIFLRMVRNLKGIAEQQEDFIDILRYVNLLVIVDAEHEIENRYLRAILYIRSKQTKVAYEDLDWLRKNGEEVIGTSRLEELRSYADRWLSTPRWKAE